MNNYYDFSRCSRLVLLLVGVENVVDVDGDGDL
jgi:hypothetical protein